LPEVASKTAQLVERLMAARPDESLEATRLHDASQTAKRDELLAATRPYEASELVGPDEKLKAARPDGKPKAEITDGLSVAAHDESCLAGAKGRQERRRMAPQDSLLKVL
jgi:hypothetical protein